MIRIDWYESKGHIITQWIQELNDAHSYMGRIIFDLDEFNKITSLFSGGKLDYPGLDIQFKKITLGDKI